MLTDFLQDRAALYVSGEMSDSERSQFELLLEFHEELRKFTAGLAETAAEMAVANSRAESVAPSVGLKSRLAQLILTRPQKRTNEALVVTGADGLVQWVNSAFTEMCGYSMDELRGRKLGPLLQGAETDRATVGRMREAVHASRPCRETILNYHKSGTPYWVEIEISPVHDDRGETIWLVAREREVAGAAAA